MMMYLLTFLNVFLKQQKSVNQIMETLTIRIIGKSPTKNTLNISADGANAFSLASFKNQSNERKVPEAEPILSNGPKIVPKNGGYLKLNESTTLISWI
jgi:hypothetical protein